MRIWPGGGYARLRAIARLVVERFGSSLRLKGMLDSHVSIGVQFTHIKQ